MSDESLETVRSLAIGGTAQGYYLSIVTMDGTKRRFEIGISQAALMLDGLTPIVTNKIRERPVG